MRPPRHPVTVESDLMSAVSDLTGLTWDELADDDVIWFMNRGMRPTPRIGLHDGRFMQWLCGARLRVDDVRRGQASCDWVSPVGRGGSRRLKEAVRQHLRDKHGLIKRVTRIVTTVEDL